MTSDITLGDCVEGMKKYPNDFFDLAVVDPPYGNQTGKTAILNFRMKDKEKDWNVAPGDDYFEQLFRVSKFQIVWGGNYFPQLWKTPCRCFIYWHKGNPVENFADGELAWTNFNRNAKMADFRYYGSLAGRTAAEKKIHPTQKPIELYKWIYETFAEKGWKILDTHLGSGSNRIAAYISGFDFTAFELDAEYYAAQEKYFKNKTAQSNLF